MLPAVTHKGYLGSSSSIIGTTPVQTQSAGYLVGIGSKEIDLRQISNLPGVRDVHRVTDVYKLVSRAWRVKPTQINLGDGVVIGEGSMTLMAGP